MKECVLCGAEYEEDCFQRFQFPYGFKQVQRVEVTIIFCQECEEVLNVTAETKGGFDKG